MELSEITGSTVLLRADLNVPIEDGKVVGRQRLEAVLPTIRALLDQGNAVIVTSHLGRPEGRQKKYSLKPVARVLSDMLGVDIIFSSDPLSKRTAQLASKLSAGHVLMLENLRYYPEEEANSATFAKALASLADVYVNDAFSVCHRAHASVVGIPKYVPAAFGLNIVKEIDAIGSLAKPKRPYVAIIGGAKISTKLGLLASLSDACDTVFVGGAMAFTMLKASGLEVGRSKVEDAMLSKARRLVKRENIVLPVDAVVVRSVSAHAKRRTVAIDAMDSADIGLDIGPATVELIAKRLDKAKTLVWNGPMGLFELAPFAKGSEALARLLARSKARTIVGGGDTVSLIDGLGLEKRFDHVSTGGGAMLAYLENGTLPGIEAVRKAKG